MNILPHEALKDLRDDREHRGVGQAWPKTGELRIVDRYHLELADTMSMDLLTTAGSDGWIRKVARVMRLEGMSHREPARLQCRTPGVERPNRLYGVLTIQSDGDGTYIVSDVKVPEHGILTIREVWQSFYPFYRHLVEVGGLPLHAALLRHEARCVLLAARAGAGKSTCCRRLPTGWEAICDEEVVVVPFSDGTWHAYPFPTWSDIVERNLDHTWDISQHTPVTGIFFLEQGDIDCAEAVGVGEAALQVSRRVREKCFFYDWGLDKKEEHAMRTLLFDNVCALARAIPGYRLTVTRTGRFWEGMEKTLRKDGIME